jgi:predicted PurR-regulated permease PerM
MPKNLTKPFILILVLLVLIGCYFVFRPFLTEILVAAVLASVFYTPFSKLTGWLKGRRSLAAFFMCLFLLIIIILPTIKIITYGAEKSTTAYNDAVLFFETHTINDVFKTPLFQEGPLRYLHLDRYDNASFKDMLLTSLKGSSNWLISGATIALKGTTEFIISLVLIILTVFFFFVDGPKMLNWLRRLTPLNDKYDYEIFRKFRAMSYTTFVSTFVTAAAQGIVGAIGFAIIGFPALLAGVMVALLSLLPYIGSMIFYVPIGIYYLLAGQIWQGIFILLWGVLIIGTTDNIIRTYMIQGKAEVNPIFVLFSILGGVMLFGFWGVVIGPLVIALAITVFHIYQLEFCDGECMTVTEEEATIIKKKEKGKMELNK